MPHPQPDPRGRFAIDRHALYVVGAGAESCVGQYVLTAAAAVRAGITRYAEHPFMVDQDGEPIIVARAPWLDEDLAVLDRIASLACDAAQEALLPVQALMATRRDELHVHLALDSGSITDERQRELLLRHLAEGAALAPSSMTTYPEGHAGGILALEMACEELRGSKARLCLVGGADSFLDPERLEDLSRNGRLHSPKRTWGFTPGEGAGFCTLATGATVLDWGLVPLGCVFGVATTRESNLLGTESVCTGEGLTAAFRAVLDPVRRVSRSYCDLNGEPYRITEYGFAVCRTSQHFVDPTCFTAAAASWGDVGSASAILALTLPIAAWSRGDTSIPVALVWASSAHASLRGAVLMGAPSPRRSS